MAFDVEIEADVLSACLSSAEYLRAAAPVLRAHDFSSPARAWIWRVLSDAFERSRELPDARIWWAAASRDWKRPEERDHATSALKGLYARRAKAPRLALEEVRRFARVAAVRASLGEGLDALDKGDVDAAEAAISAGLVDARSASALREPSTGLDWEDRLASYCGTGSPGFRFEMPLPTLNRVTGGGLPPGALGLLIAQTNVGKSTFVVDLGHSALLTMPANAHVAHVTTEETEREAFARYDARIASHGAGTTGRIFERGRLLAGKLSPADAETFRLRMTRARGLTSRLHVLEMAPGSSSSGLWSFVERVRAKAGLGVPILLCVDSPDHLGPPTSASRKDHRLQVAAVYWSLKAIAKDREVGPLAVWAVSWAGKEYERKRMTANAASETVEKGRIADFMLGASEPEGGAGSEEEEQEIAFDLLKNRIGKVKKKRIPASANMGTCTFVEGPPLDEAGADEASAAEVI